MKPRILLYKISKEKEEQIRDAVLPLGIDVRQVMPDEISKTVESLAEMKDECRIDAPPLYADELGEALVMCGFNQLQFQMFMGLFQRKKLSPVPVKAMLTESNRRWTFEKLLNEIWQEHKMMHRN